MSNPSINPTALATNAINSGLPTSSDTVSNTDSTAFTEMISEEMLGQEFKGKLTNVISKLSRLNSSLIDDSITEPNQNLLETFGEDLPNINNLQSLQAIQDPNDRQKAQINFGLVDLSSKIDTLSTTEKKSALTLLSLLETRIENKELQGRLSNLQQTDSNGNGFDFRNIENMSPAEIRFGIEKELSAMYKPLMDLGRISSDDDDDDSDSSLAGLTAPLPTQQTAGLTSSSLGTSSSLPDITI